MRAKAFLLLDCLQCDAPNAARQSDAGKKASPHSQGPGDGVRKAMSAPRRRAARPLAALLAKTLDPLASAVGVSQASLITHWPEIVGERLADVCELIRLRWPPKGPKSAPTGGDPATLMLRVAPGFALEVQHLQPVLMARVNAHLGWRCVDKIQIKQEPLKRQRVEKPAPLVIDPRAQEEAAALAAGAENEALRAALTRFGAAVLSERRQRGAD
jgi:hypothetical protein